LRAQGPELTTHRDLVAMIPIDESFARGAKKWNMPFSPLLERLKERTRGRFCAATAPPPRPWRRAGASSRRPNGRNFPEA
jgi:hypothetical protein